MKKIALGFLLTLSILVAHATYAAGKDLDIEKFSKEDKKYNKRKDEMTKEEEKRAYEETEEEKEILCEKLKDLFWGQDMFGKEPLKTLVTMIDARRARVQPNWKDKTKGFFGGIKDIVVGG
jgi:hypothetical protein